MFLLLAACVKLGFQDRSVVLCMSIPSVCFINEQRLGIMQQ